MAGSVNIRTDYGAVGDGSSATSAFTEACDDVYAAGGGVILVPEGTYKVRAIPMRSHTSIVCEPGVIFTYDGTTSDTNSELFQMGEFSFDGFHYNVHFVGPCTIDLRAQSGGATGVHAFRVWNADGWSISNIWGRGLTYGSIAHVSRGSGTYDRVARNGELRNFRYTEANADTFGCTQINGVENLTVDNMYCTFGIALRIETDGQNYEVRNVHARNLYNEGSRGCAFALNCHDDDITDVTIERFYTMGDQANEIWNETGTRNLRNIVIRDGLVVGQPVFGVAAVLGDLAGPFLVENVRVTGCTSGDAFPVLPNSTYINCVAEDNSGGQGFANYNGTSTASPRQKVLMVNCVSRRNGTLGGGHHGFYHSIQADDVTHINCAAYDDGPILGTFGSELLSTNQQGLETNTAGWSAISNCTIARTTSAARTGSASLEITSTANATLTAGTSTGTSGFAVTAGNAYTVQGYLKAAVASRTARVELRWYDSGGATLSTSTGGTWALDTQNWRHVYFGGTAPANAAYAAVRVTVQSTASGEVFYGDDFSVKQNTTGYVSKMAYGLLATNSPFTAVNSTYEGCLSGDVNGSAVTHRNIGPLAARAGFLSSATYSTATAGAATLPANPVGFLAVKLHGTDYRIPYYSA